MTPQSGGNTSNPAQSDDIIRRLEDATGLSITAPGFPAEMTDDEPEEPGYEIRR